MSKSSFRKSSYDAPDRLPLTVAVTGGELPAHRIAVIDQQGNRRGHVSAKTGSAATALRMGVKNARLKKIDGTLSWAGEASGNIRRRAEIKLQQQRGTAKGSVSFNPTKPETSARPKRRG